LIVNFQIEQSYIIKTTNIWCVTMNKINREHLFAQEIMNVVESGDLAIMGPSAFAVYTLIQFYADFESKPQIPLVELIADTTGITEEQVLVSLEILKTMGYI